MSMTGTKSWDYNVVGVAHFGMLPDFLRDVQTFPPPNPNLGKIVNVNVRQGAEYFYRMWKKCEDQKGNVP